MGRKKNEEVTAQDIKNIWEKQNTDKSEKNTSSGTTKTSSSQMTVQDVKQIWEKHSSTNSNAQTSFNGKVNTTANNGKFASHVNIPTPQSYKAYLANKTRATIPSRQMPSPYKSAQQRLTEEIGKKPNNSPFPSQIDRNAVDSGLNEKLTELARKRAIKEEYESIPERNAIERYINWFTRTNAKSVLPEDYPNYAEEYARKQELWPEYEQIRNEEAYQSLLDMGMTAEELQALGNNGLSQTEIDQLVAEGYSEEEILNIADDVIAKNDAARNKLYELTSGKGKVAPGELTFDDYMRILENYELPQLVEDTKEHPIGNNLMTHLTIIPETGMNVLNNLYNIGTGKPMQHYDSAYETIRKTTDSEIEDIENPVLRTLAREGYGQLVSAGDNLVAQGLGLAIGGPGGKATNSIIQGFEKADAVMNEAIDKGLTPNKVMLQGLASGVSTALSELLPMNSLLKIADNGLTRFEAKAILKNMFAQGKIEAAEEIVEEFLDWGADVLIAGGKNDFKTRYNEYIAQGDTKEAAVGHVILDKVLDLARSGFGGFLMGFGMGGGASVYGYLQGSSNPTVQTDIVNAKTTPDAFKTFIETAKNINTENLSEEETQRVARAIELANKPKEEITKEDIVDIANVIQEHGNIQDIQKINYQANYAADRKQLRETGKVEQRTYENQIERAARQEVEKRELSQYKRDVKSIESIGEKNFDEAAAKNFTENYKGQNPYQYALVSSIAYNAGQTGQSFDTFLKNSRTAIFSVENDVVTESYLKTMFYNGQNAVAEGKGPVVLKKNANIGKVTGIKTELNPLQEAYGKKLGAEVHNIAYTPNNGKESPVRGNLEVALSRFNFSDTSDNVYQTMIHEAFEYAAAYNPEGMEKASKTIVDMIARKRGEESFVQAVEAYREAYRKAAEDPDAPADLKAEANKTVAEAKDEFVNDAISYFFSTGEGVKTFVEYIMSDDNISEEEKVSTIQTIKDWIDNLINIIKDYLSGHNTRQLGYKYAESLKLQEEELDKVRRMLIGVLDEARIKHEAMLKEQAEGSESEGDVRFSLEIKNNLELEENRYIKKELLYKDKANNKTTFKTKDGKIGIRNNRSIYIVEEMYDTDDPYRPIRIYDVDVSEFTEEVSNTSLILAEIERNEKEGRQIAGSLSLVYLKSCGLNRPGEYIRFYDFDNMRRSAEFHIGKSGKSLSTPIRSTRNSKNRARDFGQRPSYTRFSIAVTDSEGKTLTAEQQKYFADSKVRDKNGNLLRVFHGSMANFTIFDLGQARDSEDIEAFFFSANQDEAEGYGNAREFYLNIANPADYDTAYNIFFEERRKKPEGAGARTRQRLRELGYDGVIADDGNDPEYIEYLAFSPEQIKLVTNKKPTSNEDVRFSLAVHAGDLGKSEGFWQMTSSNRGTGHFGTGTYFVGDEAQINDYGYEKRPHEKVDFANYNLFTPKTYKQAMDLHDSLKFINNNVYSYDILNRLESLDSDLKDIEDYGYDLFKEENVEKATEELNRFYETYGKYLSRYDRNRLGDREDYKSEADFLENFSDYTDSIREGVEDYVEEYENSVKKLADVLGVSEETVKDTMMDVFEECAKIKDAYKARYEDSPSTRFMKRLGYEGVDVRDIKQMDNVEYGSVIYDLKGEDLKRKQEIGTARYSIAVTEDSTGKELTEEQQEFFKDSKALDDEGNLLVLYHGSKSREKFTVFEDRPTTNGRMLGDGFYFTPSKKDAEAWGKGAYDGKVNVYKVYLNITKPFYVSDNIPASQDMIDYARERGYKYELKTTADFFTFYGKEYVREKGYDGIILKADENSDWYHIYGDQYVVFNPNQIKKTTNKKPTNSNDIRHSIAVTEDNIGRTLTEGQQKYFKNSKIVDENGKLKVMYHGSTFAGFTIFDPDASDDQISLFFTDNPDVSRTYANTLRRFNPDSDWTFEDLEEFVYSFSNKNAEAFEEDGKIEIENYRSGETKTFDTVAEAQRYFIDEYLTDSDNDTDRSGIYEVYLNAENPLIVDAKGGQWNAIPRDDFAKHFEKMEISDHGDGTYFVNYDEVENWHSRKRHRGETLTEAELKEVFGYGIDESRDVLGIFPSADGRRIEIGTLYIDKDGHRLPSTTREYAKYAKDNGYDGVVFNDIIDSGFYDRAEIKNNVVVVFNSNQIKSIYNLNPTKSEDIRYSIDVPFFDSFEEIDNKVNLDEKDLQKLVEGISDLDSKVSQKAVDDIAGQIKKQYNSKIDKKRLAGDIMSVFRYLKATGKMSMDDVMFVMSEIARPVLEQMDTTDEVQKKLYKDFVDTVKNYKISLDAGQTQEAVNAFGSYYNFVNAMRGKLQISKEGTPLDNVWTEICDKSGGALSYGTNPNDQPVALADYINSLNPMAQELEGQDLESASTDLALEIFRQFYVYQSMADAALKVKGEITKRANEAKERYKKKYNEAIKEVEREKALNAQRLAEEIDNLTADEQEAIRRGDTVNQALIENLKADYKRRLERLQAQQNEKIARVKAQYQNSWINKNLRRQTSELKNRLLREVKALQNMIAHPQEGASKHVPVNLINPTIAMLEAINLDNGGRNKAIADRLKKMAEVYESFKNDPNYSFDYDERIASDIEELQEMFARRSYADLGVTELQRVIEIVTALKTQIKNANNLILQDKLKDAKAAATEAMNQVNGSRRYDNAAMNALNAYGNLHLNAYREFRKLSGYRDGAIMDIYNDLDEGSRREMQIQKDLGQIFTDVLEGQKNQKEVKKFISTKDEDLVDIGITDKNGKPIKITRAMRMSLIMHSMNSGNMRHVLGSGITIPNMYYFAKGKLDEAYAKGTNYRFVDYNELLSAIQRNDQKKITELTTKAQERVEALKKDLSPWEKKFLRDAEKMFHEETGKLINETSLKLKGYALARVKNYFPIRTDRHFTKQEWAGLVQDASLEGMGILKERVISTKPILLEDITNVIQRQIRSTAKYAGLAVPVRNFETVMKQTMRDQNDGQLHNLYETIDRVWGSSDTKWLQNLMKDIQGGRHEEKTFLSELRGKFAGATLAINPSVAFSQAASFPTAGAVLGWKPLTKAVKDFGKGFITQKGIEELEKINPLLWYRSQGYATQDLADAKNAKLPAGVQKFTKWIEFMDTGTVRTLEYASMYYVDDHYKNLKKGSEEYWQKVSEIFSKVVEETQPNYSTLHRADVLRNPNSLLKVLLMFKTQALQNFGIVYDAAGELNAAIQSNDKQWKKEATDHFANAVSSQATALIMFSGIKILAQLMYHRPWKFRDEDDKWSWEKFLKLLGWQMGSTISGSFLIGSELYDLVKAIATKERYYGVDVSTMSMITDVGNTIYQLSLKADKLKDADTTAEKDKATRDIVEQIYNMVNTLGQFAGVPVNNIKNLISSMFFYTTDIINSIENGELEISNDSDLIKFYTNADIPTQYERIYDALTSMDSEKYDKLVQELIDKEMEGGLTEEEASEKVQKNVLDNITKIMKSEYLEGNISEEELTDFLVEEKGKTEDDAYYKIREWETGESKYGVLKDSINTAMEDLTPENRKAVIDEIEDLLAHGTDKSTISSNITTNYKAQYIDLYNQGKAADLNAILRAALVAAGYTDEEAKKKLEKWLQ